MLALSVFLANSPDLDLIPATLLVKYWQNGHRVWGHNGFVLTAWICLGAWLMRRWVSASFPRWQSWALSFLLVGSHVILDGMQAVEVNGQHPGVPLLWPFSSWQFRMPFPLFRSIKIRPAENPIVAHLTSWEFWSDILMHELAYIALFIAGWAILWQIAKLLARFHRPVPAPPKRVTFS